MTHPREETAWARGRLDGKRGSSQVLFGRMYEDAAIEKVAAMANWKTGEPSGGGRGRGIAFARYKNRAAYAACVVELDVGEVPRVPGDVGDEKRGRLGAGARRFSVGHGVPR